MPIYEYRRPDGTTFEVQQSFSEDALTTDPETGVPLERVFHPPAVHFKGKGFYNTDYGTRNRERETAAAGKTAAAGESSSQGASSDGSSSDGASSGSGSSSASSGDGAAKSEKGSGGSDSAPRSKQVAAKG